MKKIQYFDILKKSLMITWNNKFLWFFGFFIFLGSLPSNFNLMVNDKNNNQINDAINFIQKHTVFFFCMLFLFIALLVILLILYFIGNAGLIKAANNIVVYSQSTFTSVFAEAKKYILQLFLAGFLISISLVVIIIILITPALYLVAVQEKTLTIASIAVAFIIFIPLIIIAYFLRKFSSFFIVLGNMKAIMALEAAYGIFKKNTKESLIMGCVSIAASVIIAMFASVCIVVLAVILIPFGIIAYLMFAKIGAIIILIVAAIIGTLILLILFSWYSSFIQTMWVLFFQQIALEKKTEEVIQEKFEAKVEIPNPEAV